MRWREEKRNNGKGGWRAVTHRKKKEERKHEHRGHQ